MKHLLEKIKLNTELIKSLTDDNIKLLEYLKTYDSVGNKITEDGLYKFTFPNLQEFTKKLNYLMNGDINCVSLQLDRYESTLIWTEDDCLRIHSNNLSFRYIIKENKKYINNGQKTIIYSTIDNIDMQVKFSDNTLVLGAKNDDITESDKNKLSDYNIVTKTLDNPDIYSYECVNKSISLHRCNSCYHKCNCIDELVSKQRNILPMPEEQRYDLMYSICENFKCTHKCMCSNQYPFILYRIKFKYTVNIATKEIHLYADFA